MRNFLSFINEEATPKQEEGKKLKHLTHLEDHVLHNGHEGVGIAAQHLDDVHNTLLGKKSSTNVSDSWYCQRKIEKDQALHLVTVSVVYQCDFWAMSL